MERSTCLRLRWTQANVGSCWRTSCATLSRAGYTFRWYIEGGGLATCHIGSEGRDAKLQMFSRSLKEDTYRLYTGTWNITDKIMHRVNTRLHPNTSVTETWETRTVKVTQALSTTVHTTHPPPNPTIHPTYKWMCTNVKQYAWRSLTNTGWEQKCPLACYLVLKGHTLYPGTPTRYGHTMSCALAEHYKGCRQLNWRLFTSITHM